MAMVGFRLCAPPPATVVHRWILTDQTELRQVRASLRHLLDAQSLTPDQELDDIAERMTIVATELASNALRHARSPAVVTLSRARSALVLDVADDRPIASPTVSGEHSTGPGGRGLLIVQELAHDTGWYVVDGNKHVWAEFTVPRRSRLSQAPRIVAVGIDRIIRRLRRVGH